MTRIIVSGEMPESGMALGIDVSHWQDPAKIDWADAARDVGWCVAKVSNGGDATKRGPEHIAAARAAGMTVGAYHFVTDAPANAQVAAFLGRLAEVGTRGDDIAPCLDLEPLDGVSRRPVSVRAYLDTIDTLMEVLTAEYGGCWLYTSSGWWQAMGSPPSWLLPEWWVPWYPARPNGRLLEWQAREHKWPQRPGVPTPAAWQFDALEPTWTHGGEVDHNLARRLPMIVER